MATDFILSFFTSAESRAAQMADCCSRNCCSMSKALFHLVTMSVIISSRLGSCNIFCLCCSTWLLSLKTLIMCPTLPDVSPSACVHVTFYMQYTSRLCAMVLFVDMLSATMAGSFPLMLHAFSNCAIFLPIWLLSIKAICKTN